MDSGAQLIPQLILLFPQHNCHQPSCSVAEFVFSGIHWEWQLQQFQIYQNIALSAWLITPSWTCWNGRQCSDTAVNHKRLFRYLSGLRNLSILDSTSYSSEIVTGLVILIKLMFGGIKTALSGKKDIKLYLSLTLGCYLQGYIFCTINMNLSPGNVDTVYL